MLIPPAVIRIDLVAPHKPVTVHHNPGVTMAPPVRGKRQRAHGVAGRQQR